MLVMNQCRFDGGEMVSFWQCDCGEVHDGAGELPESLVCGCGRTFEKWREWTPKPSSFVPPPLQHPWWRRLFGWERGATK